jgi:hypothetical protein
MPSAHDWVTGFLDRAASGLDTARVVDTSTELDADGILQVLGDSRLGPLVIEAMSDLMHPTDSMYYDAIFGAFDGQVAVRNWLVPTMNDISFIEFAPTAPTEVFATADGTGSIDEWQMWANIGDERLPLPRGISTRHYSGGWVMWNTDVYDTSSMRGPSSDPDAEATPLPDPPRTPWQSEPMAPPEPSGALRAWLDTPPQERGRLDHADIHTIMTTPELGLDPEVVGPLFHPTESRLFEPAAELVGGDAIRRHLSDRGASRAAMTLEQVGPAMFNGNCTAFEWLARVPANGSTTALRGSSVCRYSDGWVTYACDYYDTAELA